MPFSGGRYFLQVSTSNLATTGRSVPTKDRHAGQVKDYTLQLGDALQRLVKVLLGGGGGQNTTVYRF